MASRARSAISYQSSLPSDAPRPRWSKVMSWWLSRSPSSCGFHGQAHDEQDPWAGVTVLCPGNGGSHRIWSLVARLATHMD